MGRKKVEIVSVRDLLYNFVSVVLAVLGELGTRRFLMTDNIYIYLTEFRNFFEVKEMNNLGNKSRCSKLRNLATFT